MRFASVTSLFSIAALLLIIVMFWLRPRIRTRRISGGFLWATTANSDEPAQSEHRSLFAALDCTSAALLVVFGCGLFARNHAAGDSYAHATALGRCLLGAAITAILVARWRRAGNERSSYPIKSP